MNLRHRIRRLTRKAVVRAFLLVNWDWIASQRTNGRSDLQEIGTKYGGWVVPCGLLDAQSICYCVGCGEDISFDLGLIERFGCDVFAFDPTPRAVAYVNKVAGNNPKYHFSDVGLWDQEDTLKFYVPRNPDHVSHSLVNLQQTSDYIEAPVKRLSQIMRENGHGRIDLLKIDIEGAEYRVLDSVVEDGLEIAVVCVEYDEYFNPLDRQYKNRIRSSVTGLIANGYRLVCSQGNGNYTFVKDA